MGTLLLEVGSEELPASFVDGALAQWQERIPASLKEHWLQAEAIALYATPRRLAVLIQGLPDRQPDQSEAVKGPPAQAAFDAQGQPTPAAIGFARKQQVAVTDLEVRPTDKGNFVFVNRTIAGQPTPTLLVELIPAWILNLEGQRLMRWGDGEIRFPRPIRWLVTLWNQTVLPVTLVNGSETIRGDRYSCGHRVLHPQVIKLAQADDYVSALRAASVNVDLADRRQQITQQVQAAAQAVGGVAPLPPDLLTEVVNLVEWPTAVLGKFEPDFLELPPAVITTVMVTHQRYFPVYAPSPGGTAEAGTLLPYFITISNGDPARATTIAAGNERVIRARLADAQFFYKTDCAKPLASYLPQLAAVTFQEQLGSMQAKVERLAQVTERLLAQLSLPEAKAAIVRRAAHLCKADLVTQMVYEFPELQGVMGETYARVSGEPEAVAIAIREHYLPRGANDDLPKTLAGQVVGLADRLDTLISIFGLGLLPSGSSDPFALRRAANAIVNILWAAQLPVNLQQVLTQAIADFTAKTPVKTTAKITDAGTLTTQLQDFFRQRLRTQLQEERQIDYDLVNAVLGETDPEYLDRALQDVLDLLVRAEFLQHMRRDGSLEAIYETVNRSTRLAAQGTLPTTLLDPTAVVDPARFEKASESALYEALVQLLSQTQAAQANRDYQQLLAGLRAIAPTVAQFFDGPDSVLVMDPNPDIRQNRLNLLGLVRNHARVLADFGAIVKA
ncbi:glycine--tRNA ligase subunit beta [Trichothermofontia sp.]